MARKPLQVGFNYMTDTSKEVVKMVKLIIVLVIAIVLLVVAFRMKTALQNDSSQMDNYKQTFATIERVKSQPR